MKRFITILAVAVCLILPATAQTDPPFPGKGMTEFVGDMTWTYSGGERTRSLNGTWFQMTGEKQKTGISIFGSRDSGLTGAGVGPSYQIMLGRLAKGALWGGGTLFALGVDSADVATGAVSFSVNYELYLGRTAAFRVGMRYSELLDIQNSVAADPINEITALFVGFGIWPNQTAPVN